MRLVTRSDFDGLASAALLEELGIADEIFYTHPKDVQDQKIAITANDVSHVELQRPCEFSAEEFLAAEAGEGGATGGRRKRTNVASGTSSMAARAAHQTA